MKIDFDKLIAFIFSILLSILLVYFFSGCSGKWHYTKAINKGVRCETTSDTIRIRSVDSMIINGEKTYFFTTKDTVLHYNTVYVPKTRFETRIEYKTLRDTLRLIKYKEKQATKKAVKSSNNRLLIIIIIALLIVIAFLTKPKKV
jgi:ATP-dependent Zn protease